MKSKIVAYILGFFFGGFGIHRFYTGNTGSGLAQLFLTITTAILSATIVFAPIAMVTGLVVAIWVLLDFFLTSGLVDRANIQFMAMMNAGNKVTIIQSGFGNTVTEESKEA